MNSNGPMLTGLFRDRDSAERAYQSISDRGYNRDDVNLVMSDDTRKRHFSGTSSGRETELGSKAAEGTGIGGAIGGNLNNGREGNSTSILPQQDRYNVNLLAHYQFAPALEAFVSQLYAVHRLPPMRIAVWRFAPRSRPGFVP